MTRQWFVPVGVLCCAIALGCSDSESSSGSDSSPGSDLGSGEGSDSDSGPPSDEEPGGGEWVRECPDGAQAHPRPFQVDPDLYPFQSCGFEADEGTMHFIDIGPLDAATTIVMVHGNPTWSFLYRSIAPDLARAGYRVIAVDHLGMGMSDLPSADRFDYRPSSHAVNLEAFLVGLELDNVTLVVQDWGGPIGLTAATNVPDRIDRLMIMNTWAWPVDVDDPGEFHSLVDWGNRAIASSDASDSYFCDEVVPINAAGLAQENDPSRGEEYEAIEDAYRSPFLDADAPRHSPPCYASQQMARSILEETDFLRSLETRLPNLAGKPWGMYFGLGDDLFGALRCDLDAANECPAGYECACVEELLPAQTEDMPVEISCEVDLEPIRAFHACVGDSGEVITPAMDRFRDLLGDEQLKTSESVLDAGHMIQESAPSGVTSAILDLIDG